MPSCFCAGLELALHPIMSDVKMPLLFSFVTPFCPAKCDSWHRIISISSSISVKSQSSLALNLLILLLYACLSYLIIPVSK